MIASLAVLAFVAQAPKSLDVNPIADAWVYGHAPNPGSEAILRVWGTGSDAIEQTIPPTGECSYAYFNFPVEPISVEGVRVTEAKLVVYFEKTEDLTAEQMQMFPLEVRGLELAFTEKDFHVDALKVGPSAEVFGKGTRAEAGGADKYKMTIDLLGKDSAFGEYFQRNLGTKKLGLALTSSIAPGDTKAYYRIFSKESAKNLQPRLVLKYGPRN